MSDLASDGYDSLSNNLPSDFAGQVDLFPGEVLAPYARPLPNKDLFGQPVREQSSGLEEAAGSQGDAPLFVRLPQLSQEALFS